MSRTMTGEVCPVTREPLLPGEYLSRGGAARLRVATQSLPGLMADLAYITSRKSVPEGGGSTVYSVSSPPLRLALMLEVDEMASALQAWGDELIRLVMGPKYSVPARDWRMVAQLFAAHEDRVRRWPLAPQCADEVLYSIKRLEHLAAPAHARLMFVGKCPRCGADLLAREGTDEVKCRECWQQVDCRTAVVLMMAEAKRLELPRPRATRVAELIVGKAIKDATVRSWCQRRKLRPVSPEVGHRTYRVADIVALAS